MVATIIFRLLVLNFFKALQGCSSEILPVIRSESRQIQELNGVWEFRADISEKRDTGFKDAWYMQPLRQTGPVISMPVPSSYNDITQDKQLRDFIGWAWYDTEFFTSFTPNESRVVLRFGSAHYNSEVWLNGKYVMSHSGGHLPFEAELGYVLLQKMSNRITIAINNTLTPVTLPPGSIEYKDNTNLYPPGYVVQNLQMDFFNYAGIHRSVLLYTTPKTFVTDISIYTDIVDSFGIVNYTITITQDVPIKIELLDMDGKVVAQSVHSKDSLKIANAYFWWPYTMSHKDYAYLYTLKVNAGVDVYRQPFGIRTVHVFNNSLLINKNPFYCYGFGKHEDADIRGKGVDLPTIIKDFNLMKWIGANCFRTSHYPYAEEIMDMADKLGIVVIDESPGVGIVKKENMGEKSLSHHLSVMKELIQRDKNRPSVIIWSVANEPASGLHEADHYFGSVINYTKKLDPTRPVTFAIGGLSNVAIDLVAKYVDIICINYYFAWYSDPGHTEVIQRNLNYKLTQWYDKFQKPIIVTEYGADTIVGLHVDPPTMFSEEYQVEFIKEYHKSFDKLRKDFLVGEMIWNFADFMTAQDVKRVGGNKKGVFTRQRQPKASAFILRERYRNINNTVKMS